MNRIVYMVKYRGNLCKAIFFSKRMAEIFLDFKREQDFEEIGTVHNMSLKDALEFIDKLDRNK